MTLFALLVMNLTACTQIKCNDALLCKYKKVNCSLIDDYENQKNCYINEKLREAFCE